MYAILRTKRQDGIASVCAHNLRTKYAKNVDKTKSHLNQIYIDNLQLSERAALGPSAGTYDERLLKYYEEKKVKVKENSVLCLEFVLTASPQFFKNATQAQFKDWKKTQLDFMRKEFGEQVQFAILHLDEKSPHYHFLVSVEETKIHKYKNRYGVTEKMVTSLNADRYNPIYLQKLQDRYAEANQKFGLARGLRNSKAIHNELKNFYKDVNSFLEKKDYSSVINNLVEKLPVFLGVCKIDDVRKLFTPVVNKLMKQSKAARITLKELPEKIKLINSLIEENEKLNLELKEKRDYYKEAINEKIEDNKLIDSLQKEIIRLKQYEPNIINIEKVVVKTNNTKGLKL